MSREVAEEVGLEVHSISYSSSQHWPFPDSSFMLACHAAIVPGHTQVSTDLQSTRRGRSAEVLIHPVCRPVKRGPHRTGGRPLVQSTGNQLRLADENSAQKRSPARLLAAAQTRRRQPTHHRVEGPTVAQPGRRCDLFITPVNLDVFLHRCREHHRK